MEKFTKDHRQDYPLGEEYACYHSLLCTITKLMHKGTPTAIAIDGRCGSGKTSLAELIASLIPCNLIQMDHFFLPVDQRGPCWQEQIAGNMDLTRFRKEVAEPINVGTLRGYRAFNCKSQAFSEIPLRTDALLTVVEGSYSLHPGLGLKTDLSVFLTCSDKVQEERLRRREGLRFRNFLDFWIPMEERYHQTFAVRESADMVIDTDNFFRKSE